MHNLRQRVLAGELVTGTFLNLASPWSAEIAAQTGFDWITLDMEHGLGDDVTLAHQIQAISTTPTAPLVRIAANDPTRVKRALDMGAAGVMVPFVSTADEARRVADAMHYPPQGIRGVNGSVRATGYGRRFAEYLKNANDQLLTMIQIETKLGVDSLEAICAVEGVDVLFVGPLDLSVSLGIPQQWDHPTFKAAVARVVEVCRATGKCPGMHCLGPEMVPTVMETGFRFVALGMESRLLAGAFQGLCDTLAKAKAARD